MEEAGYRGCPYMMCIFDDVWGTNIKHVPIQSWLERIFISLPGQSICLPYPLVGLQSLPLQELELLQLVTEAVPKGSLLLGAAGVRLVQGEGRHFIVLIDNFIKQGLL